MSFFPRIFLSFFLRIYRAQIRFCLFFFCFTILSSRLYRFINEWTHVFLAIDDRNRIGNKRRFIPGSRGIKSKSKLKYLSKNKIIARVPWKTVKNLFGRKFFGSTKDIKIYYPVLSRYVGIFKKLLEQFRRISDYIFREV